MESNGNDISILNFINKKLTKEQKADLVWPITEEEIRNVLENSMKKRSPGPDGLTYEFYIKHYDLLKADLLKLYNDILIGGVKPPSEFSEGLIALIPKTSYNQDLNNSRPISLLNCDYKIFTKILAKRIQAFLSKIVEEGQTACVNTGSCIYNLDHVRQILVKANKSKKYKLALLSIDMAKAFDSVIHSMLWEVLKKYEFPDLFIDAIRNIYEQATSKVLINGFTTNSIKIQRAVRQGCPLSMILFVLYLEPLIRQIYSMITGVLISNKFLKVLAYADDVIVVIKNDEEFDTLMKILTDYGKISGIKLNKTKSSFIRLNNCKLGPQQIPEKEKFKVLGMVVANNWNKMTVLNYDSIIQSIKGILSTNSKRKLNIFQKSWILNTFVYSKLWYIGQIIPPSNRQLAEIQIATSKFLWNTQFFKIGREQLYSLYEKGGINLVDPETKMKSLFIKLVLYGYNGLGLDEEHFMIKESSSKLNRTTTEWLREAVEIKPLNLLNTSKLIYSSLITRKIKIPKIETKYPELNWKCIWKNLSSSFIPSDTKETLYFILNDVIANKDKQIRCHIDNIAANLCSICNQIDTNIHRIKYCKNSSIIWEWLKPILQDKPMFEDDPTSIFSKNINARDYQGKAVLFLVSEGIHYQMKHYHNPSLFCFKQRLRNLRWNNKETFRKQFRNCLCYF